jgi:peptidyl-prolyl cis-trans isomerase B (cyclophilin B)
MKHALFETTKGNFLVELDDERAPKTVANFLAYVNKGHYNGLIFHRVINGFMVQGGGFEANMKTQRETDAPIANEAQNGLKNELYTIAMARTNDPHSATAQFFINVNDNDFLNHSSLSPQGWGYAVFGKVIVGEEVIDAIRQVKTGSRGFHQDVPLEDIVITAAYETDAAGDHLGDPCESPEDTAVRLEQEAQARALGRQKGAVITQHLVEGADTQLLVAVGDNANEVSGANHYYVFSGFNAETHPSVLEEGYAGQSLMLHLLFQNGVVPVVGQNGVTLEAVLAACGHRLQGFQDGKFACDENQEALDHINAAIEALQRRTRARIAREVEGTHVV